MHFLLIINSFFFPHLIYMSSNLGTCDQVLFEGGGFGIVVLIMQRCVLGAVFVSMDLLPYWSIVYTNCLHYLTNYLWMLISYFMKTTAQYGSGSLLKITQYMISLHSFKTRKLRSNPKHVSVIYMELNNLFDWSDGWNWRSLWDTVIQSKCYCTLISGMMFCVSSEHAETRSWREAAKGPEEWPVLTVVSFQ